MKIMFCLGSLNKGGAERVVSNLSNEFVRKNNDVTIVTTIKCTTLAYKLDKKIRIFSLDKNDNKSNKISRNIKRIQKLKRIILKENPDIILTFLPEPTYRVMLVNLFTRKKVIISVRNDPNIEYNNLIKKLLVKLLYTSANGFVFQTNDAKEWFSKKIQEKSVIIYNPIGQEFLCEPYNGKRENKIVSVGRLVEQKNHKMLIDAFNKIKDDIREYKLYIYGDGPLKEQLISYITKLKLLDRVIIAGNVNDIKEKIYKSKLFVLTSNYEGMPNSLIEAMSLGVPCISTDCKIGGPKELLENEKNGLLVNVEDSNELAKKMLLLIRDEKLSKEISKNGNKKCKDLSIEIIANKWIDYIKRISDIYEKRV